jgi:dual specificity protein phosphatase-like protein
MPSSPAFAFEQAAGAIIPQFCGQPVDGTNCQLRAGHQVPCLPDPLFETPNPADSRTEIVDRLWQGGSFTQPDADEFDSVLTLWEHAPPVPAPTVERRLHFLDSHDLPSHDTLLDATSWVIERWQTQHHRVLVRCHGGLNRSGLIIALVLMSGGSSAEDAISLIRARRSPYSLCNPAYEEYLRQIKRRVA